VSPRWIALVHQLPERTRLRTPVLRGDEPACERAADALAAVPGVRKVAVRPYTGSILVDHEPTVGADVLVAEARRVLDCTRVVARGEPVPVDGEVPAFSALARKMAHAALEIDREVRRHTEGAVDLGTLAALGFVGAGMLEVATSDHLRLPPWFNLGWWAFRTFMTTERDEIQAELESR